MTQKKKNSGRAKKAEAHGQRSVLNLNERIFAALENDPPQPPLWPQPPLVKDEIGRGSEADPDFFDPDTF